MTSFGSLEKVLKTIKYKLDIHKIKDNLSHFPPEQVSNRIPS